MPKWPSGNWRRLKNEANRERRIKQFKPNEITNKRWRQIKALEFQKDKRVLREEEDELEAGVLSYIEERIKKGVRLSLMKLLPNMCEEDQKFLSDFLETGLRLDNVEKLLVALEERKENIEIVQAMKERMFSEEEELLCIESLKVSEERKKHLKNLSDESECNLEGWLEFAVAQIDKQKEKGEMYKFIIENYNLYKNRFFEQKLKHLKFKYFHEEEILDIYHVYDFNKKERDYLDSLEFSE